MVRSVCVMPRCRTPQLKKENDFLFASIVHVDMIHMFSNREVHMGKALEVRARKSTNITLPPEVLDRARELGINLSRASERGVREEIQETEARRWGDDNAELVAAYSAMVEQDGLPLAKYRTF